MGFSPYNMINMIRIFKMIMAILLMIKTNSAFEIRIVIIHEGKDHQW